MEHPGIQTEAGVAFGIPGCSGMGQLRGVPSLLSDT